MEYIAHNAEETQKIAHDIVKKIISDRARTKATIFALHGDLGSGKTNFAQAVAKELGITETVPSPTFIIVRAYNIKRNQFTKFIHIDAYRLKGEDELHQIGWDDIKNSPRNLVLIEWADRIEKAIPKDAIKINFEFVDKNTRNIKII